MLVGYGDIQKLPLDLKGTLGWIPNGESIQATEVLSPEKSF
jgi:hypothetical protein